MASVFETTMVLIMVVALGGFLFIASTIIFLLEEAAKYLIHGLGESTGAVWDWFSSY